MNLSADVAEGSSTEEEILPSLDSASVCCGAHAGSLELSQRVAARCRELGIEIGAHPGYADRENFGRRELGLSATRIASLVEEQVRALAAAAEISYVKAHGALYHRCQIDAEAAVALARVAASFGVGLVGQPGSEILAAARRAGVPAYREGFADRGYLPDGSLVPRSEPGALLAPEAATAQALRLARSADVDTICLHSDSPAAAELAPEVRRALGEEGISTRRLRQP